MNCKHCQLEIYKIGADWHLRFATDQQTQGATGCLGRLGLNHEPASPVAQPENTSADDEVIIGAFCPSILECATANKCLQDCHSKPHPSIVPSSYPVAQSGAGGPCEDCLWHGCEGPKGGCGCKCHKRPSSPSGQAAAPTPETHTPKDEQFWQFMEENAEIVKRWPGWKRIAAGLSAASPTGAEPPCADCDAARRHAYSDATTPGFFHDRCQKHRAPAAAEPSAEPDFDEWLKHIAPKVPLLANISNYRVIALEWAAHVTKGLRDALAYAEGWSDKWQGMSDMQEKIAEGLREQLDQAKREREEYRIVAQRNGTNLVAKQDELRAAEAQLSTAREALRKYGEHRAGCKILGSGMVSHKERICTCGLAALAPAKEAQ